MFGRLFNRRRRSCAGESRQASDGRRCNDQNVGPLRRSRRKPAGAPARSGEDWAQAFPLERRGTQRRMDRGKAATARREGKRGASIRARRRRGPALGPRPVENENRTTDPRMETTAFAAPLSNKPLQRTKAANSRAPDNEPRPRGSSDELRPPRGRGRATIDQPLRPSPLNGKAFDKRDRILGRLEFWRRRPSALGRKSGFARRRSSRLWRRSPGF